MTEHDWQVWAQLYYDDDWQVLEDLVASAPGVQLERGVADDLDIKAGTCSFRLWDDDDLYRPSNAASSLYGQTGPWMKGAFATGGHVQFTGEASKMSPGETDLVVDAGNNILSGIRWVDVALGGPLARVGRWRDPLEAPLVTQITRYGTLRGYFPLQDGRDATRLTNLASAGRTGIFSGARLAAAAGPGGSDQVLEMVAAGNVQFPYASMSASAGFQICWADEILGMDATLRDVFTWRTTVGHTWSWKVSNTQYQMVVTDADGTVLTSLASGYGSGAGPGQWVFHRVKVSQSGGTVTIEPSWYPETGGVFFGLTLTYSGAMGAPIAGNIPGNVATDGAHYGHHFVLTGVADNLETTDFTSAFNGYIGETAADRFDRLCSSRGLPFVVRGDYDLTAKMGAQPIATFQDQLKEIRSTEGGLIFDRGDDLGIVLVTKDELQNNAATPWELTYPDDIGQPFQEVTGTTDVFNLITARNRNAGQAVREITDGRLGSADPPAGSGRLDKTVDVNLETDGGLDDVASWWANFYTQDVPRYDTIIVDLDANYGLLTAANAAEPGTFIRLTGRTPDPLLLMIISKQQATQRKRNVMTFKVVPGDVYQVAVYDDAGSRYTSTTTTSAEAMTTTETGWDIITTNRWDCWGTRDLPYDWKVAGERVTVTAMTAPVRTSSGWTQTATVTRSVNGVVKTHDIGEVIELADSKRYG